MRRRWLVGMWLSALACGGGEEVSSGDTGGSEPDADADSGLHTELLFEDDFVVAAPDDLLAGTGLPAELFASDGSRWTNIQNTHPGENLASHEGDHVRFVALGRPDPEASKVDLVKDGWSFAPGDVVVLTATLRFDGSVVSAPHTTTLLDLEDSDDLLIDGQGMGAGLRVWLDSQGFLGLNRGELVPALTDEERLDSMASTTPLPVDEWVTIEAHIKLGVGVDDSTDAPIDDGFDADATDAWCEVWMTVEGGPRTLVLRQQGVTFLDRDVGLAKLAEIAPDVDVVWPEDLTFDSYQVGLSNNRSQADQALDVRYVAIERR